MYQRILVPLEREGGPEAHLRHAERLAKEEGAELTVLRVITVIPSDEDLFRRMQVEAGSSAAKSKQAAEAYVSRLTEELRAEGVNVGAEVIISDQAEDEAIATRATEIGADLIVMPRQRRSLFSRWLQGNVRAKLQRRTDVPILTVWAERED
jgi:nucleotide-binding universal stress UspA family protein